MSTQAPPSARPSRASAHLTATLSPLALHGGPPGMNVLSSYVCVHLPWGPIYRYLASPCETIRPVNMFCCWRCCWSRTAASPFINNENGAYMMFLGQHPNSTRYETRFYGRDDRTPPDEWVLRGAQGGMTSTAASEASGNRHSR